MGTQNLDRAKAIRIIRDAADMLKGAKIHPDDAPAIGYALADECGKLGIAPEAFDAFVMNNPELEQLKIAALREALAGTSDPGPHDAISREAATGQPGDHAWGPGAPGAFAK